MKDHGIKPEKLYPTMADEPKKIYPHFVSLPASAFEGEKYEPGHKCKLEIEVEIESMHKDSYECRLLTSDEKE